MNVTYTTSIQGEYTLYDEAGNVLCETDNLITDWGMRRFVGDRSMGAPHPVDTDLSQQAFVNNMKIIMLGTGSTAASSTDWQLENIVPLSSFTITNEAGTTGTLLSTDSNDDLLIIFNRMTRFKAVSAFADVTEYPITEIGCNWSDTVASNNRYGIFSRAVLPAPVTVKPKNTLFAKYRLMIKTNCNKVLSDMPYLKGTGAAELPLNKTNVRRLPLYTLTSNGFPSSTLNGGAIGGSTSVNEFVQPLFEDTGLWNYSYVGGGYSRGTYSYGACPFQDTVYGTGVSCYNGYKLWWLQMYTSGWATGANPINGGANPATRYSTFTSTTTSALNNASSNLAYSDRVAGSTIYDQVVAQNLNSLISTSSNNSFTGRKHPDLIEMDKLDPNTWQRRISFLFTPGEFKQNTTVLKLYPSTLGDWDGSGSNNAWNSGYKYIDTTATHDFGIVTVFDSPVSPPTDLFNGFQYIFTFVRN